MKGPNIKRGVHLERLTQIAAVTPTIAYMLGLPMPRQAEGPILWEAMEDPDFRLKETKLLKKQLDRWKRLYAGLAIEYDLNPRPEIE